MGVSVEYCWKGRCRAGVSIEYAIGKTFVVAGRRISGRWRCIESANVVIVAGWEDVCRCRKGEDSAVVAGGRGGASL